MTTRQHQSRKCAVFSKLFQLKFTVKIRYPMEVDEKISSRCGRSKPKVDKQKNVREMFSIANRIFEL